MENEDILQFLMTNTLGESILVETLKSAAYFITRSNNGFKTNNYYWKNYLKESQSCYYFVQGTGLDILIEEYHLNYNPSEIRNIFNSYFRRSS